MKNKTLFLAILFAAVISSCLFADDNRLIFTEFGVSYASVIAPPLLENSTTGVLGTASFDAKVGVDILKWADVYIGGDFMSFTMRQNYGANYTFYPIYGGIRANIFPDWIVYPGILFELGKAISSQHLDQDVFNSPLFGELNSPLEYAWAGTYYNFGFDLNMNVNDIAILSLKIDRPAISSGGTNLGEIHILRVGLAWKMLY